MTPPRSERGAAAVELALITPLLLAVLLGTIDFGRLFYRTLAVTHAVRAGLQYGSRSPGYASDHPGVEAAAMAAATDIPSGQFTATATHFCTCYTGTEPATVIACSGVACAGEARVYSQVTGTATFTTVVNYPGIPHVVPISHVGTMRAQ